MLSDYSKRVYNNKIKPDYLSAKKVFLKHFTTLLSLCTLTSYNDQYRIITSFCPGSSSMDSLFPSNQIISAAIAFPAFPST